MDITTKYNLEEKIYLLETGKICEGHITKIEPTIELGGTIKVKYTMQYKEPGMDRDQTKMLQEDQFYKTPAELCTALMDAFKNNKKPEAKEIKEVEIEEEDYACG